jgi:hypothetical protein
MGLWLVGLSLAMLVVAIVAGSTSQARGQRAFGEQKEDVKNTDDALHAALTRYYRKHANVRLGPERRLANGAAWRLLTDIRTGGVAPRITWMADRRSMLTANALFEAIQGAIILSHDQSDLWRRRMELYRWDYGYPPEVIKSPYVVHEKVAVTYATSRLVSYVDVTREIRAISMGVYVFGRVLDLEQRTINSIERCPDSRYDVGNFRFGELLDVCDDEAYGRFLTLWADKVRRAVDKARASGDGVSEQCGESMEPLARKRRELAFYLTPTGVSVFNEDWFPNMAKFCAFYDDITVNPIVLTYQELAPFMKAGPWRDDVLRQLRPTSRQ